MAGLKEYEVLIGGTAHTLLLSDEDAARYKVAAERAAAAAVVEAVVEAVAEDTVRHEGDIVVEPTRAAETPPAPKRRGATVK
jgi:hypothetical protein